MQSMKLMSVIATVLTVLAGCASGPLERLPDQTMGRLLKSEGGKVKALTQVVVDEKGTVRSMTEETYFNGKSWYKRQNGTCMVYEQVVQVTNAEKVAGYQVQKVKVDRSSKDVTCP